MRLYDQSDQSFVLMPLNSFCAVAHRSDDGGARCTSMVFSVAVDWPSGVNEISRLHTPDFFLADPECM